MTASLLLALCLTVGDIVPPSADSFLREGKLAEGEAALADTIAGNPKDSASRFGLGVVQFLRGVETLVQGFHRYGLQPDPTGGNVWFLRLPVPANPHPEPIAYEDLRALIERLNADLARAEATLSRVEDPDVKLPIHFGEVRLDLDGDGKATDEEALWSLYKRLNGQARNISADDARRFVIAFDRGDVAWLRGYCHLLMAFCEVYLAHDGRALFDHSAHLFFPKTKTPFPFLKHDLRPNQWQPAQISDVIAFVHMIRLPVREPKRAGAALRHLEAMIPLSRESWKAYLEETDDDREWIPNPRQTTVMPGVRVTEEMVKGWFSFLDEAESILGGKTLVPFWRDAGGKGVNLRRVFTEPTDLDPVLWFQGTAAAPYLEEGKVTSVETWRRLQRVFGGEFVGFALWFN